jgi:sulfate adenylyltransferase
LVSPHGGGELKLLLREGDALVAERKRAPSLTRVPVTSREKGDLVMLGIGGFTPLEGFMTHADWKRVCDGVLIHSLLGNLKPGDIPVIRRDKIY